jgi:hypothetical protein
VSFISQRIKFQSKDPNNTEDESDTDEVKVRYILISPCRYSDAPVPQVDSVDLSDILLRLEKSCKEEMAKVEWEPEHSCGPFTCTASTENIMIYLDDSASESFKGIEPIFMLTSGLGVNTAMLDEYRVGRGPRPREGLDLLASLRKGRSQSAEYSKQATGSSITAGCDPRPTILSYADIPKEPEIGIAKRMMILAKITCILMPGKIRIRWRKT